VDLGTVVHGVWSKHAAPVIGGRYEETVKKFEAQDSKLSTVHKRRRALEAADLEFMKPADGKGPGVRLKREGKR
jgi:hypothetical protein